jgi:hypothetical protein
MPNWLERRTEQFYEPRERSVRVCVKTERVYDAGYEGASSEGRHRRSRSQGHRATYEGQYSVTTATVSINVLTASSLKFL